MDYSEMKIKVGQKFWSVADDFRAYANWNGERITRWTWVVTKVTPKQFCAKAVGRDVERRFWRHNLIEVSSDIWHRIQLGLFEEA